MRMRLSSSEHSEGSQHLGRAAVGAAQHPGTDQCPPRSPYRKGAQEDRLSGHGHQDVASHRTMAPPLHSLAPKGTPQFWHWEKSLDFEISLTWVQVPAPPT